MRSVLRWLRRLTLGVLLLVTLVVGAALVTAHTSYGREWLRARVEQELQQAFPGGARVGAIEGSILGTLTVRDLELDGRDRQPMVTVDTLQVAVALWPLVFHTAEVDELVADGVHVVVHRQPPAPEAASPEAGAPAQGSSPWQVELPLIEIHHATIEIDAGHATQTVTDVDIVGIATVEHAGVTLFGWSHGAWRERGAALTAAASVVLGGGVHVPGALVTLGDGTRLAAGGDSPGDAITTITAADLAIDIAHPGGTLAVSAPARVLAKLVPELDRAQIVAEQIGDVAAVIDIATATPTTTRIELHATAGPTTLWAALHGDLAAGTARGVIRADALDLGLVTRGRASGRGDVFVIGEGHRTDATIFLDDPRIVATSRAVELARKERITGQLAVGAKAHGTLSPVLQVTVAGEATGDAVAVEDIAAASTHPKVEIASMRVPFDLRMAPAKGDPRSPGLAVDVTGKLAGTAAAIKDLAIATVSGSFAARVAAGAPHGEAHLNGAGIRNAGTPLGVVHVDLETYADGTFGVDLTAWPPAGGLTIFTSARVALASKPIVAALRRSAVTLPNGMRWEGRGGSIVLTDAAVTLRDLTLRMGDATLALRGAFARSTGTLTAHVEADRIPASVIDARARGAGGGALDLVHRGGGWQADGRVTVAGFAAATDAAPLDGTAHVALDGRRATLEASASSPALGRVELAVEATAPLDLFDPGAWRALDRSAVHNATITARDVTLAGLAGLAGPARAGLTGTLDGTINLAPAALGGRFAVRGVELPPGVLDGDLTFAPHDGDLSASATARLSGIAAADATARLALPARPLDPATWQHRGRDLLKAAALDVDDVELGPVLLARSGLANLLAAHGVPAPEHGRVTVALAIGAEANEARLAIDLDEVTGAAIVAPLSEHLAISAGAGGTHLRSALRGHDVELGVLDADVPMTPDRWISEPSSVLRAPITARWTLPATPLPAILAIVDHHELAGGTLEGTATIRGTLGTPILELARLVAREVSAPPRAGGPPVPVLADLELTATWGGASGTVRITGHEATGGELHAMANGRPDRLADVTGSLGASQLDLAPIAAVVPRALVPTAGTVTKADLTLHAGGRVTGDLHVTGGALPLSAMVGTLREIKADLKLEGGEASVQLDGTLGHGALHLEAMATPDLAAIDLRALRLQNVSLLGGLRPRITATLKTTPGRPLVRRDGEVTGDVTVEDARITLPEHTGTPLLDASMPSDLVLVSGPGAVAASRRAAPGSQAPEARGPAHPWLSVKVAFDAIQLVAHNVADSVGLDVRASFRSDGPITVSAGETVGLGGAIAIEHADVDLLGRHYLGDPSTLVFTGSTDPQLDIHLTHQFPDLALNVAIGGTASRPALGVTGTPGSYTRDQLFGFLLGGEPGGDASTQTGEAVKNSVALAVSGMVGRRISKVLPIKLDTVSCEPTTTATSASCTVGKWLSQRLFLAYRHQLEPAADGTTSGVQLQYRLGSRVLIEGSGATGGTEGTGGTGAHYGADLLWRHRW